MQRGHRAEGGGTSDAAPGRPDRPSAFCEPSLPACLRGAPAGGLAETQGVESVKELLRVNTALRPGEAVYTRRVSLLLTQGKALSRTGHFVLHSSGHGSLDFEGPESRP